MFSEMVQRSEQLFFTPVDALDERLFHLPLFLEALASVVKEVDEVMHGRMLYIHECAYPCTLVDGFVHTKSKKN